MTNPWVLSTTEPHSEFLYLSNGYLGTALDWDGGLTHKTEPCACYVRGTYDVAADGIDRLAVLPCWNRVQYYEPAEIERYERNLNLRHGYLDTRLTLREARGLVHIEHRILLSRHDRHLAAVRIAVQPEFDGEIAFLAGLRRPLTGNFEVAGAGHRDGAIWMSGCVPAYDIAVGLGLSWEGDGWRVEDADGEEQGVQVRLVAEVGRGQESVVVQRAQVVTSDVASDPVRAAGGDVPLYAEVERAHSAAWDELWQTDIEVEGDPEVQQFVRAGLFYLWSTVWPHDSWSIAPMGLSSNGYNGHIFWDAELWMYPSLLVTHPHLGYSCVAYRERTIGPARERARSNGHRGAQYPWEGAYTGAEMTPYWAETRDFQLHITADVAIGQWWYYLVTEDLLWLEAHGFPVIRECAEYWVSRVEYNPSADRYEISDVVCADEYAAHVNNDAFTNAAVTVALSIAKRAAKLVGEEPDPQWRTIAERMYVPYDSEREIHREYDGYAGEVTKQADVELLAFPLEYTRDTEQVARDLAFYGSVIDPDGPAMSFSVYAILHAQLGRPDDTYAYLRRSFMPNTRRPFWAFSETPTNNEYFFCTGVGGALQALLFGCTGIRLREGSFALKPLLPSHWKALRLRNLSLAGARVDTDIEEACVVVRRRSEGQEVTVTFARSEAGFTSVRIENGEDHMVLQVRDTSGLVLRQVSGADELPLPVGHGDDLRVQVLRGEDVALDVTLPA